MEKDGRPGRKLCGLPRTSAPPTGTKTSSPRIWSYSLYDSRSETDVRHSCLNIAIATHTGTTKEERTLAEWMLTWLALGLKGFEVSLT